MESCLSVPVSLRISWLLLHLRILQVSSGLRIVGAGERRTEVPLVRSLAITSVGALWHNWARAGNTPAAVQWQCSGEGSVALGKVLGQAGWDELGALGTGVDRAGGSRRVRGGCRREGGGGRDAGCRNSPCGSAAEGVCSPAAQLGASCPLSGCAAFSWWGSVPQPPPPGRMHKSFGRAQCRGSGSSLLPGESPGSISAPRMLRARLPRCCSSGHRAGGCCFA